ncbi:dipeptide/oligopeptide/nickel ABC transporter permease/ATP-binding protein [Tessaracoccus rhinocerotis]|uniref:Dipeptide/oligopeptide/nickel ABC transporter permease/ATP-binding protein n=1 Tax=Tessaracoccus rhinocerotis TaxID=1689449 RepID=A0A553JZ20_9ACTN|nr:dipeptide/oligopeptide/nickel ABC transporter permease/ATP-binding protein [Tessaracoccus rhinocerotis]TRY17700.1 dipeptide/oligopeptide/nickel ABC transporter permease/ATP-binding protein [Tessaracoccus rhinocerotis]
MTDVATTIPLTGDARRSNKSVLRRLVANPQAVICLVWLLGVLLVGALAPWLATSDPNTTFLAETNAGPGTPGHPLGVDSAGRDVLNRLIWGARESAMAVAVVTVVSVALGVSTGLIAGFYRGRFESIAGFITDVVLSMPGIVLLIALYALTGPDVLAAMAVYGVLLAPSYYRLVRSIVLGVRNELYVDAARVVGLSDWRIVGRHVLWAVRAPVIIQSSFVMASGIGIEAGVSFLGLGDPTSSSWGIMLQQSFNSIYNNPILVLWPALVVSITILALILFGNALSDVLQASARSKVLPPRARRRALAAAREALPGPTTEPTPLGSSDDVILSIRDLRIGYPAPDNSVNQVVHGVDLDVRRGEIHGLVGESGSGKSQIAFSTLGILPKEALVVSGHVMLDGEDLLADDTKLAEARGTRIGYVPQEPMTNLDPSFTIGRQLVKGLRAARPMSKADARKRLEELLVSVGITDPDRVMGLYPHEISGGMAQRVLICGAIASQPDIIVADEPTTALDVTVQAEVLEILRNLSLERGMAMILVTHNLGVVADLCDTVSVMKDGLIVESADVEELFSNPREEYTQQLLASSRSVELMEDNDE